MSSLSQNPFFEKLTKSKNILLVGAGGGFDIYSGIPLYLSLRSEGKKVHLANFSFTNLGVFPLEKVYTNCFKVNASTKLNFNLYFPEKYLADWLKIALNEEIDVFTFAKQGVIQLKNIYQYLIDTLEIDTVILIDGGTDSLMFGDESGLGTPYEDMASIAALSLIDDKITKYLVCLGFGIDHFHGVSHYDVLQNIAELAKINAYIGCFSVGGNTLEGQAFVSLVKYATENMQSSSSIVCNSIASAIEGHFGNHHSTLRTESSELFINPLMNIYWTFELRGIINKNLLIPHILETRDFHSIRTNIADFRETIIVKSRKNVPL